MYTLMMLFCSSWFFFFKQKTAYEMRISDWSSDVCSSDLSCQGVVLRMSAQHTHPGGHDGQGTAQVVQAAQGAGLRGPPDAARQPLHRHEERAPDHDDRRYSARPSSAEEHAGVPQALRLQAVSAGTESGGLQSGRAHVGTQ